MSYSTNVSPHELKGDKDIGAPIVETSTRSDGKSPDERGSLHDGFPADVDEKKLMRKVDFRLIPWLCVLYLLSFLDRSAIGNARLYGLEKELKLTSQQYNMALTVFFFPYALFEVPSNVLLKRLRPSIWFPVITILVGICMLSQGLVHNYTGILVARFFLGVTEAGLFPGCNYLISGWYKRNEFGLRASVFFSAATASGAFGGLLSFAINKMGGVGDYSGWRWILSKPTTSFGPPLKARALSSSARGILFLTIKLLDFSSHRIGHRDLGRPQLLVLRRLPGDGHLLVRVGAQGDHLPSAERSAILGCRRTLPLGQCLQGHV